MVRPHVTARGLPIVVAGPTAAGKSALARALAQSLDGEIICADSRQVYAGFTVAAAGATAEERAAIPHHLDGAIDPRTRYTAADFVRDADRLIADIEARERTPILVGGTGMWLRAWRTGLDADLPSDPAVRAELQQQLEAKGLAALVAELARRDPDAAAAIDVRNPVRVVRALEVALLGGQRGARSMADVLARPARVPARWLRVTAALDELAPHIAARADAMFRVPGPAPGADRDAPIVQEARALRDVLEPGHPLLATLGTAEALLLADGVLARGSALAQTVTRTRQYARRQLTWFNKEPWWTRLAARAPTLVDEALSMLPRSR